MDEAKMFEIKDAGSKSVEKLRSQLIKDGWSLDYFKKFDEITEEIQKLDSEFRELARQKMTAADEKTSADINNKVSELGQKISDLKLELEEITFEEETKIENLKK